MKKICFQVLIFLFSSFTVLADEKLKFGTPSFYPPYILSGQSGYTTGLDIEVVEAICTNLNVKCTVIQLPMGQLFSSLNNNQIDAVVGAISITPDKKSLFSYTHPYLKNTMNFVTLTKSNLLPTVENLKSRRIGVIKDSIYYTYITAHFPNATLLSYDNIEQLISDLTNQKIDVALMDTYAADYWVTFNRGQLKKIGAPLKMPGEGFVIATKQNNPLVQKLNSAIATLIKNARLDNIVNSYIMKKK